jgi:hypothetical protein
MFVCIVAFFGIFALEDLVFKGIPTYPVEEHNQLAYFSDGILIVTIGFFVWLGCKPIIQHLPPNRQ